MPAESGVQKQIENLQQQTNRMQAEVHRLERQFSAVFGAPGVGDGSLADDMADIRHAVDDILVILRGPSTDPGGLLRRTDRLEAEDARRRSVEWLQMGAIIAAIGAAAAWLGSTFFEHIAKHPPQ